MEIQDINGVKVLVNALTRIIIDSDIKDQRIIIGGFKVLCLVYIRSRSKSRIRSRHTTTGNQPLLPCMFSS